MLFKCKHDIFPVFKKKRYDIYTNMKIMTITNEFRGVMKHLFFSLNGLTSYFNSIIIQKDHVEKNNYKFI